MTFQLRLWQKMLALTIYNIYCFVNYLIIHIEKLVIK